METQAFRAVPAALVEMDAWLSGFSAEHGLPGDITEELRVCLHELATNVITHGGADGKPHDITLAGHMDGASAVLDFSDDAPPFDPLARKTGPASGPLEDLPVGGLGLHLVRSFTDALTYRYEAGRNHLTLARGPRH